MTRYLLMTLLCATTSLAASDRAETIESFFNAVSRDTMHVLDDFYASDVHFIDPLGELHGLPALRAYYERMYEPVTAIQFYFPSIQLIENEAFATWTMTFSSSKLKRGRSIVVDGLSHIRFGADGKVIYHRDYFDVGAMVYEHVPVLGFFTRYLKRKLGDHP